MDILQYARVGSAIRQRFENGEALTDVAADLRVPPEALRPIYDEYRLERLEAEIRARPSFIQLQHHRTLGNAVQVLAGNSAELLDLIHAYETGAFHRGLGLLRDQDAFFATVGRLLHNYVAAAVTVVYHLQRVATQSAFRQAHPAEYQRRYDAAFKADPLAMFVRQLRNKTLKEYLASGVAASSLTTTGFRIGTVSISLDRASKQVWGTPAYEYLQQRHGHVAIREMVEAYDQHVAAFIQWLIEGDLRALAACYQGLQDDLRQLQALADELGQVVNLPYLARGFHSAASTRVPMAARDGRPRGDTSGRPNDR